MGKGRDKRKRRLKKQSLSAIEEIDVLKEKEMERVDAERRTDAERRARLSPKHLALRGGSDPPPILGEPDSPVLAPLKPKPSVRSGAVALPEPESDDAFSIVTPHRSE